MGMQNENQKSAMIFYHVFFSVVYLTIGVIIGAVAF